MAAVGHAQGPFSSITSLEFSFSQPNASRIQLANNGMIPQPREDKKRSDFRTTDASLALFARQKKRF